MNLKYGPKLCLGSCSAHGDVLGSLSLRVTVLSLFSLLAYHSFSASTPGLLVHMPGVRVDVLVGLWVGFFLGFNTF